jgi:tetratricopeptide (TPR) repeat protein
VYARILVVLTALLQSPSLSANERSRALIIQGFDLAYNLDYGDAISTLEQAIAADPKDPAAYRALATAIWLHIVFMRGAVTVDDYLGSVSKTDVHVKPPTPELAAAFHDNANKALGLAEARVRQNPRDADASYQEGAVVGLIASYSATIDGKIMQGFRSARRAFNAQERAMALDARRKDAGLIVGTYRYLVSTLAMPVRWMAYAAGFGGGREAGLALIEAAAAQPSDAQTDAKFALVLIHNREKQYDRAFRVIHELQGRYPRNRLLWLEAGATAIRGRRYAEAESMLDRGTAMLAADRRPRMLGEQSIWKYKRGAALLGLGRTAEADTSLREALKEAELKAWVRGRIHAELGKLADLAGNRTQAREHYRIANQLAEKHNDPIGNREAERWLREPYGPGK